jgi:hypothetical protein
MRPLEDKEFILKDGKCSDDDNNKEPSDIEHHDISVTPIIKTKRIINPFKLVWKLIKNRVSHY